MPQDDAAEVVDPGDVELLPTRSSHQEVFAALLEHCDVSEPMTDGERAKTGRAAKALVKVGAPPADIAARAANYRTRWPDAVCSPRALEQNWSTCAAPPPPRLSPWQRERQALMSSDRLAAWAAEGDAS